MKSEILDALYVESLEEYLATIDIEIASKQMLCNIYYGKKIGALLTASRLANEIEYQTQIKQFLQKELKNPKRVANYVVQEPSCWLEARGFFAENIIELILARYILKLENKKKEGSLDKTFGIKIEKELQRVYAMFDPTEYNKKIQASPGFGVPVDDD